MDPQDREDRSEEFKKRFPEYVDIRRLEDGNYIGVLPNLFTNALCYGLDECGIKGRFCYERIEDAIADFNAASKLDISNPPDNDRWIKHKGHDDFLNPRWAEAQIA